MVPFKLKLIPGEFNRALLDKVATAAHAETKTPARKNDDPALEASVNELGERVTAIYGALQRFRQSREAIITRLPTASAPLGQAELEQAGLAKREVREFLDKLVAGPVPDFELDLSKAQPPEFFAERFAAAVPKVDKPPVE